MKFVVEMFTRGVDYVRFRNAYHSDAFNREVVEAVKLRERTLQEHVTLPDGKERRRVHVVPRVQLPAPVQKLLSGRPVSYEETTVFDPASRTATFAIDSIAGEAVQVAGEVRYLDEGVGVRLRFEGEAKVKLLGVGGLVERYLVGEVKARYAVMEQVLQKFVDDGRDREPAATGD